MSAHLGSIGNQVTTAPRLAMIGVTIFVAWCIAFVIHHAQADRLVDRNNIVIGRDFMAFYVGGRIVLEGEGRRLYDPHLQQQTQDAIVSPEKLEGLSYYINPAPVAAAYSLLARLPYRLAFYVHTLLMLGFFLTGMWVLLTRAYRTSLHWLVVALLAVTWPPLMHTITGGQNAALTLMLLCAAFAATRAGRQGLSGLALGLLLFKPQYALPLLGLLLLRRQFITVAVAGITGAAQYVVGALFCGWDWPQQMSHYLATYYRTAENASNSAKHISLLEVLDYSLIEPLAGAAGVGRIIFVGGYVVVALMVLYLIGMWRDADPAKSDYGLYWALAVSATLLISPHTQYYDGALLILPIILNVGYLSPPAAGRPIGSNIRWALLWLYVSYFPLVYVPVWFPSFRFQPVFLVPVCICIWAAMLIRRNRAATRHALA